MANWIKVRKECSCSSLFETLFQHVEKEVENANFLNPDSQGSKYVIKRETAAKTGDFPSFEVKKISVIDKYPVSTDVVLFKNCERYISVDRINFNLMAFPKWNKKDLCCNYLVDGEPKQVWEISKMALEPMFFREL